jgi:hypothetical protein
MRQNHRVGPVAGHPNRSRRRLSSFRACVVSAATLALLISGFTVPAMGAASPLPSKIATDKSSSPAVRKSRFPRGMPERAKAFYAETWGVDQLSVKLTESGQLVRFTYRVVDAKKATPLQDRTSAPSLIDEAAHVALQVPTMEKVGPLRQAMAAVEGKLYWIAFSNKGMPVKRGHNVSVVIGPFRADALVVQ